MSIAKLASLILIAALAAPAAADEALGPTEREGVHTHDGFYLRIATGFGGYSESITAEDADRSTQVTGMASVSELTFGGAVRPGLILGGGFFTSSVLSSERTVDVAAVHRHLQPSGEGVRRRDWLHFESPSRPRPA